MKKVLLIVVFILASCGTRPDDTQPTVVEADTADMIYWNMLTSIAKNGVRIAKVQAESAWYYQQTQTAELKSLRVEFYDSLGRLQSVITSKAGTFYTQREELDARDSVVATTPGFDTLRTPHLLYAKSSNQITSDTAFVMKRPDKTSPGTTRTIRGANFVATPDFKTLNINSMSARITNTGKPAPKRTPPKKPAPAKDSTSPKDSTPPKRGVPW